MKTKQHDLFSQAKRVRRELQHATDAGKREELRAVLDVRTLPDMNKHYAIYLSPCHRK